jgi:hypothetical protein
MPEAELLTNIPVETLVVAMPALVDGGAPPAETPVATPIEADTKLAEPPSPVKQVS